VISIRDFGVLSLSYTAGSASVLADEPPWPPGRRAAAGGSRVRGSKRSGGLAASRQPSMYSTVACARLRAYSLPGATGISSLPRVRSATLEGMPRSASGRPLTLVEVSRRTGLEQSWLRRLCQRGDLPATKAGRDWLVSTRDLANFERRHIGRPTKG